MRYVIVFHVVLVSLFATWPAWATVEISGRVLGPAGEPAAGVMVVARHSAAGRSLARFTDTQGAFSFPQVPAGEVSLIARWKGLGESAQVKKSAADGESFQVELRMQAVEPQEQMTDSDWIALLPDSEEKLLMRKGQCTACHTIERLLQPDRSEERWRTIVKRMNDLFVYAWVPDDQMDRFVGYMKANSGDNAPTPRLVNVPQPLNGTARGVSLIEYDAPSLSSQLHDLCMGPDGNLWYADYSPGNKIGRFNPDTAEFTEWDMPTENSYPHSVITDEAGNLWITEALGNKIAVFNIKTETFKEYPLPIGMAFPHTHELDSHGNLWFTNSGNPQDKNLVMKLDPRTGTFTQYEVLPQPWKFLYGLFIDSQDRVYFSAMKGDVLGRIDAKTDKIEIFSPPTLPAGVRRFSVDAKDNVWVANWVNGKLLKFDPLTEKFTEFSVPAPKGAQLYTAYADGRRGIWYSDVGANAVGLFQPATHTFTEWPFITKDAEVRKFVWDEKRHTLWYGVWWGKIGGLVLAD